MEELRKHIVPRSDAKMDVLVDWHSLTLIGMAAVWFACLIFGVLRLVVALQTGLLTPWWGNAAGLVAMTALLVWYWRRPQTRSSGAAHGTLLVATLALLIPIAYGLTSTIWWLSLVGFSAVLLGRQLESKVWEVTIPLLLVASVIAEPYVQIQGSAGELPIEAALAKIVFFVILIGIAVEFRRFAEQRVSALHDSEAKLKKQAVQLEATNKELEAFSYSVSHDLRAPLRHIDGFTKLLNKNIRNKIDEESQNYFDNIIDSSKQMNQLIDDLLIFSRTSRKDMKKVKFNMKTVIDEAMQTFDSDIKENNISITVDDLPDVIVDVALIQQAWVNLISNAIKFTGKKENPEIHIGTDKDADGNTIFFIKDNGVGFDQKYVDKIFDVFQRLHSINDFPGTGIGLANVKRIITKHGGNIQAEGKINEGASFFFTLPDA